MISAARDEVGERVEGDVLEKGQDSAPAPPADAGLVDELVAVYEATFAARCEASCWSHYLRRLDMHLDACLGVDVVFPSSTTGASRTDPASAPTLPSPRGAVSARTARAIIVVDVQGAA